MRTYTLLVIMVVVVSGAGCSSTEFDGANSATTAPEATTTTVDTTTTEQTLDTGTESLTLTTSPGSVGGGQISVYPAEQSPHSSVVVNSTNDTLQSVTLVQNLLRRAAENGSSFQDVTESQLDQIRRQLKTVPDSRNTNSEYYIRYNETVYRLLIMVDD